MHHHKYNEKVSSYTRVERCMHRYHCLGYTSSSSVTPQCSFKQHVRPHNSSDSHPPTAPSAPIDKPPSSQWRLYEGPRSPPSYFRDLIFPRSHCYTDTDFSALPATPRHNTACGSRSRFPQIPHIPHGSPSSR